ncbi:3'-5' exonuclease [Pseudotamlana agarivorans]|uniref:3'-5' exonuclease n=1 Tax=Pseudotamlana agarivorans TaxID=481183 RepID=UPI0008314AEA|nr:3'-5' exonuclease [Tamlana agarivorans]
MEEIVLSKEQEKAINYNKTGAYAIKGIAGSGKTTVGLHRVPFLASKCVSGEKILVVTFHKILINYLEHLIEKENSKKTEDIFHTGNVCDFRSIDSLVYGVYQKFRRQNSEHKHYQRLPEKISNDINLKDVFKIALDSVSAKYPSLKSYNRDEFLKDEVDYINNCGISTVKEYQVFSRSGRNRFTETRIELQKKSNIREAIFQLRRKYNNLLINEGLIDWPVMRLLALKQVTDNPPKQYTHIVIDECQDMDRTQLDFLKNYLVDRPNASATFLYDNTQSIYKSSWLGNGHSFKSLGVDIKGRSKILKHNFRTTYEIQEAAQSLIVGNELITQEIEPVLINRSGTKPFWAHCNSFEHQVDYIYDIIKTHSEILNFNDIIVTARTWNHVSKLNDALRKKGVDCGILKSGDDSIKKNQVRIMTVHSSKGLESEVVIMADLNEGVFPWNPKSKADIVRELKLVYVGMTRASKHLYLTSYGKASIFFDSINHKTLDIVDLLNYREFQPVHDKDLMKKMSTIKSQLMEVLENATDLNASVQTKEDYEERRTVNMQMQHQLAIFRQQLIELKEEVPANTSIHDFYNNLWNQCECGIEDEMSKLFNFINTPLDLKECIKDLKYSFYNFQEKTIESIATPEYELKEASIKQKAIEKDCAPYITSYSKALEMELRNLVRKEKFNDTCEKTGGLSLYKMLNILEKKEDPYKLLVEMLRSVDFRRKRNSATHYEVIKHHEVLPIQEKLMKQDGVFDLLNDLLND